MNPDEKRKIENFVLSRRLEQVNHPDNLHFLAELIQDHDHLREVLMTESDRKLRRAKLETMRPYLRFRPQTADWYEMKEVQRAKGAQPFEQERAIVESKSYPDSRIVVTDH